MHSARVRAGETTAEEKLSNVIVPSYPIRSSAANVSAKSMLPVPSGPRLLSPLAEAVAGQLDRRGRSRLLDVHVVGVEMQRGVRRPDVVRS
jgi:hypothetical protein